MKKPHPIWYIGHGKGEMVNAIIACRKGKVNMLVTRFIRMYSYKVMDAIKDGKQVMCLNRATNDVFNVNKLSIEKVVELIGDAEELENAKGNDYYNVPQIEFWYGEITETKEESNDAV